jgi:hypothetical protein
MAFIYSSTVLQPISVNGKRVIAELTAPEHSPILFFFGGGGAFRKFAKSDYQLRHVPVCPSVYSHGTTRFGSHWMDFHENLVFQYFRENSSFATIYIFDPSRSVLLRMRNVSDRSCRENQNTFCVQ